MTKWIIIGIGGATCSGKTTLAKKLDDNFKNSILIKQDTYFLPKNHPRHVHVPQLNHHNWDILSSLDMDKMYYDILKILSSVEEGKNEENGDKSDVKLLIIDGFLIFNYKPISDLCNVRFFLELSREECKRRRNNRVYDPPDVPGYFDIVVWPEYVRYKREIEDDEELMKGITFLDGTVDNETTFERVLEEINEKFKVEGNK